MKRRIFAFCLLIIMLLSFAACTSNKSVITVSGQDINEGVFIYYLDKVMSNPAQYGVKEETKENLISAAELLCKKYGSAIAFMNENGIVISTQRKQAVATQVENLWSLYSAYYKSVGVEKTELTKVITHEYRMKQLVDYYFGADGRNPVSDSDLKEEFVDLYVGFRAVAADLTKVNDMGETIDLTEKEKTALKKSFSSYAQKINDGDSTIEEVNISYNDSLGLITTEEPEMSLVKKGDPMYGDGFFEKVMDVSHGRATVIEDGKTLYLIQRQKIATTDEDAFAQYRTEVLETVKMPSVEKKINKLAKQAECEFKESKLERIYEKLSEMRMAKSPQETTE